MKTIEQLLAWLVLNPGATVTFHHSTSHKWIELRVTVPVPENTVNFRDVEPIYEGKQSVCPGLFVEDTFRKINKALEQRK